MYNANHNVKANLTRSPMGNTAKTQGIGYDRWAPQTNNFPQASAQWLGSRRGRRPPAQAVQATCLHLPGRTCLATAGCQAEEQEARVGAQQGRGRAYSPLAGRSAGAGLLHALPAAARAACSAQHTTMLPGH